MKQNDNNRSATGRQRHGISLNKAVLLLQQHLGNLAPSRATLHRHSTKNLLSHLSVRGQGSESRQYFDPDGLVSFYKDLAATNTPTPSRSEAPMPTGMPLSVDSSQLAAIATELTHTMLARMDAVLGPLTQAVAAAGNQAHDLNKTRTSLMLKYDSAANLTQQRLDAAMAEIQRLRSEVDLREQMTRLRIDISRLQESVNALKPKH